MFANADAQTEEPDAIVSSPGKGAVLMHAETPSSPEQQLALAVSSGDLSEVERLLGNGVDPNSPEFAQPVLHQAVESGNRRMTEVLINNGARVNSKDVAMGSTPFMVAGAAENSEMMRLLILAGANINARDAEGDDVREYPKPESRGHVDSFLDDEARRRSVMGEAAAVGRRKSVSADAAAAGEPAPPTESHTAASAAVAPSDAPAPQSAGFSSARAVRVPPSSGRSSWSRWLCCCSELQDRKHEETMKLKFDSVGAISSTVCVSERSD